jgi:hypothetical protein
VQLAIGFSAWIGARCSVGGRRAGGRRLAGDLWVIEFTHGQGVELQFIFAADGALLVADSVDGVRLERGATASGVVRSALSSRGASTNLLQMRLLSRYRTTEAGTSRFSRALLIAISHLKVFHRTLQCCSHVCYSAALTV